MADDPLAAELAAMLERAEQITTEHDEGDCDLNGAPCTGHDAVRLIAVVTAAIGVAAGWEAEAARLWAKVRDRDRSGVPAGMAAIDATALTEAAEKLREAITAELLGQDAPAATGEAAADE